MPDFIDRLGAELLRAANAGPQVPTERSSARRPRIPSLRWRPLVLAAVLIMLAAAAAFAASAVFTRGTPVGPAVPPIPTAYDGAVIPSTVRLLPLRVADPHGGPAWGLRILHTSRGEVCLEVGRLAYRSIGALGVDGAFRNDGRFHQFSARYLAPDGCAVADARGNGYLYLGIAGYPISAMYAGANPSVSGCLGRGRHSTAPCPVADTRDLYYGLLGPEAVSITYRAPSGRLIATPTVGSEGAYLVVMPARKGEEQGSEVIGAGLDGGGAVLAVSYRDGHTCWASFTHSCGPVGLVPVSRERVAHAQIASTITVRELPARSYCAQRDGAGIVPCWSRVPRGFIRFAANPPQLLVKVGYTARRAVNSSSSYYDVSFFFPHSAGCGGSSMDGPTESDIRAGQRMIAAELVPSSCHGVTRVVVSYHPSARTANYSIAPGMADDRTGVLVGRARFRVP